MKLRNIAAKIGGVKFTVHHNVLTFQKFPKQMFMFVTTICGNFTQGIWVLLKL